MAGKGGVRPGAGRKLNTREAGNVRQHIDVVKIVKKVQKFLSAQCVVSYDENGKITNAAYMLDGEDVTMTKEQLTAATLLLSKSLPTLAATELSGEVTNTQLYVPVSDRLPDPRTNEQDIPETTSTTH